MKFKQILSAMTRDGVMDKDVLMKSQLPSTIVQVGCSPFISEFVDPDDLQNEIVMFRGDHYEKTHYLDFTQIQSPSFPPELTMRVFARSKPCLSTLLSEADGIILGNGSPYTSATVNHILEHKTTHRLPVGLLGDASIFEGTLKKNRNLSLRLLDGEEFSEFKMSVDVKRDIEIRAKILHILEFHLRDLSLAISRKKIETHYTRALPQLLDDIVPEIKEIAKDEILHLCEKIDDIHVRTMQTLLEIMKKPFRKDKRKRRARRILDSYADDIANLVTDTLSQIVVNSENVTPEIIIKIEAAYTEVLEDLQIDPNFDWSETSFSTKEPPRGAPISIPELNAVIAKTMGWTTARFAILSYVMEVIGRIVTEKVTEAVLNSLIFSLAGTIVTATATTTATSSIFIPGVGTLIGALGGALYGGVNGVAKHMENVKNSTASIKDKLDDNKAALIEFVHTETDALIVQLRILVLDAVGQAYRSVDRELIRHRDSLAEKVKLKQQDYDDMSLPEIEDRLRRYKIYRDEVENGSGNNG